MWFIRWEIEMQHVRERLAELRPKRLDCCVCMWARPTKSAIPVWAVPAWPDDWFGNGPSAEPRLPGANQRLSLKVETETLPRQSNDLIDRESKYSKHEMSHDFGGSPNTHKTASELILEPGVDPLTHRAFPVAKRLCPCKLTCLLVPQNALGPDSTMCRVDDRPMAQAPAMSVNFGGIISAAS